MLARHTPALPTGRGWRFEPKYDGMRVLAVVTEPLVQLLSREGNNKARQFPEVVAALRSLRAEVGFDFVIDCELVGVLGDGFAGFQSLANRISVENAFRISLLAEAHPAAIVAFDLLLQGSTPLLDLKLEERRRALVALLAGRTSATIRLGRQGRDGARMLAFAVRRNLEGVVAKREDGRYVAGQRTSLWLKYKLTRRQEFVVAGFTVSDRREHFRALVLGYYEGDTLVYAGAVGTGFSRAALADCHGLLTALEPAFCPFPQLPETRGPVRWVRPEAVAEVLFEQWTNDGKVRNPRFVTMRTDKRARDVVREVSP